MVKIYEGGINSNSEYKFVNEIKQCADEGKNILVIVPDQFSFEYDKQLYNVLGAKSFNSIQTAGFNRLAELMIAGYGENGKENIDDNAKIIMMYKAVKRLKKEGNVKFYKKSLEKNAFISSLINLVEQLRQSGVTPESLQIAAENLSGSVSYKLFDIVRIYNFYLDELEKNHFQDSVSLILQGVKLAKEHGFFKGKHVFVSSFTDFSYDEKRMIEECIHQSEGFSISLMIDEECIKTYNNHPFAEVIGTEQEIKTFAAESSKSVEFIYADEDFYMSDELRYVSKNLFYIGKKPYDKKCNNVKVISSCDLYEETEYICSEILRLVREENYYFNDIAVTVRDLSACSSVFEGIFERYSIPFFIDMQNNVNDSALVHYFNALFNCLLTKEYKTDNILKFVKSPLGFMLNYEISDLEDYCIKWNVDGNMWNSDFTADDGKGENYLKKINEYRAKIIAPLDKFKLSCENASAKQMCRALYKLLEEIDISKRTYSVVKRASLSENDTQLEMARGLKQLWKSVLSAVKSIYDCLGDEVVSLRQFCELFRLMLSRMKTSNPPQKLDCVRICDAGHSRLSSVKVNFAAEVIDGIFPAKASNSGLITEREKELLDKQEKICIFDNARRTFQSEKFISYSALSMPSDKLYVLYSESDLTGKVKRPSQLVKEILGMFSDEILIKAGSLPVDFYCTSYKTAYSKYLEHSRDNTPEISAVRTTLELSGEYGEKLDYIESIKNPEPYRLTPEISEKLFLANDVTAIYPTSLDAYYKCPFNYFCKYGLGLKTVQPVVLEGANKGNVVHSLLKKIMELKDGSGKYDENFTNFSDDYIKKFVDDELNEFYKTDLGGDFGKTDTFRFLFEKLKDTCFYIVKFVQNELNQSDFRPVAMEYKLDKGKDSDILTISLENNKKIILSGIIDRVDIFTDTDGKKYVRIIDYKTGKIDLDYSRIYLGLNLQMFVYLTAVLTGKTEFSGKDTLEQAGIAYFRFKENSGRDNLVPGDALTDEQIAENAVREREKKFRPLGFVVDDEKMKKAYAHSTDYKYVPFDMSYNKKYLITDNKFTALREFAMGKVTEFGESLAEGKIQAEPVKDVCRFCDFQNICREPYPKNLKNPGDKTYGEKLLEKIKEGTKEDKADEC